GSERIGDGRIAHDSSNLRAHEFRGRVVRFRIKEVICEYAYQPQPPAAPLLLVCPLTFLRRDIQGRIGVGVYQQTEWQGARPAPILGAIRAPVCKDLEI